MNQTVDAARAAQGRSSVGETAAKSPELMSKSGGRSAMNLLTAGFHRYAIIGVWAVMVAVFALIEPKAFLTTGTVQTILGSQQPLVFLTMALVCTFVVGEFDLSVTSIMGMSATIVPVLNVVDGVNIWVACAVALAAAVVVGAVNGFLVVVVGVDAIVVTLGMGTLLIGISLWIADLTAVSGLSADFAKISTTSVLGLPISFYYGVALAAVFGYIMLRTPLGRHMTFVGANREVARLAGVRVNRLRFGAFVASGVMAGIGGIILTAGVGGFDPNSSSTYLLPAFAAAFLSTAVIVPGRFNPLGGFVAIYFLETGIVGLQLLGYSGWISDVFFGAALVIAVTVSTTIRRRAART
jgi:ribose transport system permease protein